MAELSYIKIFFDQMAGLETLTNEEVGSLLRGLWRYAQFKETPVLAGNERFLWPMLKNAQDKAEEAYSEYIQKASESGKKGGRPKKGNPIYEKGTLFKKGNPIYEKGKKPIEEDEEEEDINPQTPKGGSDTIAALVDFAVTYGNVKDNGKTPLADLMRKFLSWGATVEEITDAVQLNSEWFNGGKSGLQRLVWAIHSGSTKDLTADELEAYNEWKTRQGAEECD